MTFTCFTVMGGEMPEIDDLEWEMLLAEIDSFSRTFALIRDCPLY
jgi:hypothetical protein